VAKNKKLIKRLKSKPKDFTFNEANSLLISLGMKRSNKGRTSGSRVEYSLDGLKIGLHKPHPGNEFKRYQVSDLLDALIDGGLI